MSSLEYNTQEGDGTKGGKVKTSIYHLSHSACHSIAQTLSIASEEEGYSDSRRTLREPIRNAHTGPTSLQM